MLRAAAQIVVRSLHLALALALAVPLCACDGLDSGQACIASQQCHEQLCYANVCRDPKADDDHDGLTNAVEHELGSHPDKIDSDGDGIDDGVEFGKGNTALDSDGDGKPDLVESRLTDADLDCLPDQVDADDAVANTDPQALARDACSDQGVCAGHAALIRATCQVGQGILQCDYGDVPDWHVVERCDGADDDCDGLTDEGFAWQGKAVGVACKGTGACGIGVVECAAGAAVCSTNPDGSARADTSEACNGVDDDCDGVTDNGYVLAGAPIGGPCIGTGECGVGVVVCGATGSAICSSDPGGPDDAAIAELCNGLDDDCDGQTDDGIELAGTPLGGPCVGTGICGKGVVACRANGTPVCSTNPGGPASGAVAEICNGLDDNCDGGTDEGLTWDGSALGAPCTGVGACGEGTVVCGKAGKATCSTMLDAPGVAEVAEFCNGLDDDCDGLTDEGLAWQGAQIGQPCSGLGACGPGVVECSATGSVTCSTLAGGSASQVGIELCNNADDDCDGLTDEDAKPVDAPSCLPVGICANAIGEPVCTAGVWACAYASVPGWQGPSETSCDGKDNDCDGSIDEGLAKVWAGTTTLLDAGWPGARVGAASVAGGGSIWAGGGSVGAANGAIVLSDELWRLDLTTQSWVLVARDGAFARKNATLAWLPAGWVAKTPRLWLIGGQLASGAVVEQTLSIDPETGEIAAVMAAKAPEARTLAAAVLDEAGGSLWLLGGVGSKSGSAVQRFDAGLGAWAAPNVLPQLDTATGPATACRDATGSIWWLGSSLDGSRALRRLGPMDSQWQARSAQLDGDNGTAGGRLLCDVSPGEHWLLGAATGTTGGGTDVVPLGMRRYTVAEDGWAKPSPDASPQLSASLIERVGTTIVVAFGVAGDGTWSSGLVLGGQGWTTVAEHPTPMVGAEVSARANGDVLYVGGAAIVGSQLVPSPVWRSSGGTWTALAPSNAAPRLHPLVIEDPVSQRTLVWGGVGLPWAGTPTGSDGGDLAPTPGGMAIDATLQVHSLGAATLAWLPQLRSAARVVPDAPGAAKFWAVGRDVSGATVQLWLLDAAAAKATLLQSDPPAAVGWGVGADLVHLGTGAEVRLISANNGLQVRKWTASAGAAWKVEASVASVPSGAVVALGRPGGDDVLLLILPPGGTNATTRRLRLVDGNATIGPGVPWNAPFDAVGTATWAPSASHALLASLQIAGQPRARLSRWDWNCLAP